MKKNYCHNFGKIGPTDCLFSILLMFAYVIICSSLASLQFTKIILFVSKMMQAIKCIFGVLTWLEKKMLPMRSLYIPSLCFRVVCAYFYIPCKHRDIYFTYIFLCLQGTLDKSHFIELCESESVKKIIETDLWMLTMKECK